MISLYLFTFPNKKVYIGQTDDANERLRHHKSLANKNKPKQIVHRAIKKYGVENCKFEVFQIVSTPEEADQEEIYWIARMRDILGKSNVYNVADGGRNKSFAGMKHTEKSKKKMSRSHIGINKGMNTSPKTNFRNGHKINNGRTPWNKGKKYSFESIRQIKG